MNNVMYQYIMNIEMLLFMKYKVQFFDLEKTMSLLDLQSFVQMLERRNEEIEKNQKNDNFQKGLLQIRDILNYMTLHDTRIR